MTNEEFERDYAERAGLTREELREFGLRVRPCRYSDEGCPGWEMVTQSTLDFENETKAKRIGR